MQVSKMSALGLNALLGVVSHGALFQSVHQICDLSVFSSDVVNHGADAGFSGFIYYSETSDFTQKHKPEIIALAKDMAEIQGLNLLAFIQSFNCLKDCEIEEIAAAIYTTSEGEQSAVNNALAWFALETAAYAAEEIINQNT